MDLPPRARRLLAFGRDLYREVGKDRLNGLAAEVAFFGALSLFPGLLMIAAALGSLEVLLGNEFARQAQEQIVGFLNAILTSQASGAVASVEQLFTTGRGSLLTFATLAALWSLGRGFATTIRALNLAYDSDERRSWVRLRLLSVGLSLGTVVMAAIVLAMIVLGPLFGGGAGLAGLVGAEDAFVAVWQWARWPVAFTLLVVWAGTLFHIAPNRRDRTRWRHHLPGALLTAVLWLVVSGGFNVYLRVAGAGNPILGVLGGGLILLLWIYLLSFSLLLGGEVNGLLRRRRRDGAQRTSPDGERR